MLYLCCTGEMNICESESLIHLFEPKVITTGDEVGIMARAMYGTLQEFQPDVEPIKAYLERANVFFEANSIAAGKRVPVLLSAIGPKIYSLLRSLTSPALPHEKSFDELATILQSHFQPKPLSLTYCRTISSSSSCGRVDRRIRR